MKKDKNFNFKLKAFLSQRGYSFVEMITILTILLILVLAASMTFVNLRAKSRNVGEKAIIATLQLAINQYHLKFLDWPNQDVFNTDARNPFTLMQYPPLFRYGYTNGDGKETWGIVDNGSGGYLITCPHADVMSYSKGYHWAYYYTGFNTGKIIITGTIGH
jgi:competence protein ComGC